MTKKQLLMAMCLCAMVSFGSSGKSLAQDIDVPDVSNKVYDGGSVTGNGGAIRNEGTLNIADSIFEANVAKNGGAIDNIKDLYITGNTIFQNNSTLSSGRGAAIHVKLTLELMAERLVPLTEQIIFL